MNGEPLTVITSRKTSSPRLSSLDFPPEEAARQVEVVINWGRYAELLAYNDRTASIDLENQTAAESPPSCTCRCESDECGPVTSPASIAPAGRKRADTCTLLSGFPGVFSIWIGAAQFHLLSAGIAECVAA